MVDGSLDEREAAVSFLPGSEFVLWDLTAHEAARGRYSYDESENLMYFFVKTNPGRAFNLQERATMVASFEFPDDSQLVIRTLGRRYSLQRSSDRLSFYGDMDGYWYCPLDGETWQMYIVGNELSLSQSLAGGKAYFTDAYVFFDKPPGRFDPIKDLELALTVEKQRPAREDFNLTTGRLTWNDSEGFRIIFVSPLVYLDEVVCYRVSDT